MERVKCECGHVNPPGTILCESCGKILVEEEKKKQILDMRYEGTARRSQVYKRTVIDKVWGFFSSVKIGVLLIVITLIASAIGTLLPQEMNTNMNVPASQYYAENYGWIGQVYYLLGFHNLYSSWWYLLLIASIGVSLVICSLDRFLPLYKALKTQKVIRHNSYLKRQRLFNQGKAKTLDKDVRIIQNKMQEKHYFVKEEQGNLFAEKGRFSRWGPYINHIGLIVFLIGGMLRFAPGMYVNEALWLREGETLAVPGTNQQYYIELHQFHLEFYNEEDGEVYKQALQTRGNIVKNFQSNVTLYKAQEEVLPGETPELEIVRDDEIRVNKPLKFDSFLAYQASYKVNEIASMTFALTKKETGDEIGTVNIDLVNPDKSYDLGNGYGIEVLSYFPDVEFENGIPKTKSPSPNNPAFAFKMISPEHPEGERSVVAIQQTIEPLGENDYKMTFKSVDTVNYTGLTIRKDLTLWLLSVGGAIFLIGVVMGSFWQHRRIWVKQVGDEVFVSAHTNKNWYGFSKEIEAILEGTSLPVPIDRGSGLEKPAKEQGVTSNG